MAEERRKTKWAIPWSSREYIKEGHKILVRVITSLGAYGDIEDIKALKVEKVAPNMLRIQTETEDYYIYDYSFPKKDIGFPKSEGWRYIDSPKMPELGERMTFIRNCEDSDFKEETISTNPILKIDVISPKNIIVWCKEKILGKDVGYIIEVEEAKPAPKGNYYWIGSSEPPCLRKKGIWKLTIEFGNLPHTSSIDFIPRNVTELGDAALIEDENGVFYIAHIPISSCWKE